MTTGYETNASPAVAPSGDRPSIGELLAQVSEDFTTLVRQEVELAKAEVKESATRAGKGAGMLAGAGVAGHLVLIFLSVAVWWGIGDATGHGWSALIVAAIWGVLAAVMATVGRGELKTVNGVPRTAATVRKIPDAVKGNEETS